MTMIAIAALTAIVIAAYFTAKMVEAHYCKLYGTNKLEQWMLPLELRVDKTECEDMLRDLRDEPPVTRNII